MFDAFIGFCAIFCIYEDISKVFYFFKMSRSMNNYRTNFLKTNYIYWYFRWEILLVSLGVPGIFSGCFANRVPKSSFRDLGTKNESKRARRDRKEFKMEPK